MKYSIILIVVLLAPTLVAACSCAEVSDAENLESSDLAVRGVVIESERVGFFGFLRSSASLVSYDVRVSEVLKGDVGSVEDVVRIRSEVMDGASCGYSMEAGEEHELYLMKNAESLGEHVYATGLCSGNKLLSGVRSDSPQPDVQEELSLWKRFVLFLKGLF